MSLSKPVERELAHTRTIICQGYERKDGLWDIEAQIVDTKPYSFPNKDRGGQIAADEALHDMKIRLTVDATLLIHGAEAVTDAAPFNYCTAIHPAYSDLVGLRIAPGWNQKLKERFGGIQGCTHITELLATMATAAFQTVGGSIMRRNQFTDPDPTAIPKHLHTCHALAFTSPVVLAHWPHAYQPPQTASTEEASSEGISI